MDTPANDKLEAWLDGIDDPKAVAFLKNLFSEPSPNGKVGVLTSMYHIYFGDPSTLTPMLRQMRMEFYNSRKYREDLLVGQGLPLDTSYEEFAEYLRQKAIEHGLL